MLLEAPLTGMRSRSRSSRSRALSSVSLRSFRSAMLCLFFLICDGSPPSRDVYCGMVWEEIVTVGDGVDGKSRFATEVAGVSSGFDGGGGARGEVPSSETRRKGSVGCCCNRLAPLLSPVWESAADNRDRGPVNS
jgi:hypothetical protein